MQIEMARVPPTELLGSAVPEDSATVARRILAARGRALRRNGGRPNAHLAGSAVQNACSLTASAGRSLREMANDRHLTARSVHRLLRVARTIADLADRAEVDETDVLAAGVLRDPGRPLEDRLAA